jgi:hypothetical protein
MREPLADIALDIHVLPLGLLPVVHVAPPSLETCNLPPASPATMTLPVALVESECQISGVGIATDHA